tara:strand:+ start:43 stop:498 length:456 start_codon:yes stop_codon:yes gene_type:complete
MHVPNMNNNQKTNIKGSISQVDLVPTILELSNSEVPENLHGKSLVPILNGDANLQNNDVFIQWNGMNDRNLGTPEINRMISVPWRGVVTGDRWKLNLSPGDQCELYNLNTDPYEINNLYNLPEQKNRIRDMSARIRIWQDLIEDDMILPPV